MTLSGIRTALIDNAPSIFTGMAVAGVVETTILAVKATPAAITKIYNKQKKKGNLTRREMVKEAWTCYIPTACVGGATIACIVAANSMHIRKEASIAAAYSLYEGRYNAYRQKNKELFGEENDEKIEKDLDKELVKRNPPPGYLRQYAEEDSKFLCYEPITNQYFMANKTQLLWAELTANKIFQQKEKVTLNEILRLFPGASCTRPIGDTKGWFLDDSYYEWMSYNSGFWGNPWMDIEPRLIEEDGHEVFVIEFSIKPMGENVWDLDEVMDSQDKQAL